MSIISAADASRKEKRKEIFILSLHYGELWFPIESLSTCSSIFICFSKQQLGFVKINHVIYFSQYQLLFAKTDEDRTKSEKVLLCRKQLAPPLVIRVMFVRKLCNLLSYQLF